MRTHHVFISHSWTYSQPYDNIVKLLENRSYFSFKNYSVSANDPIHNAGTDKQLIAAIRNQMAPCGVILILAGVYATHSKWIGKEIDLAHRGFLAAKPIIAVEPWGSERTSVLVKNAAIKTVKWNTDSIIDAIRSHCL